MAKISFLGAGRMASAMVDGLLAKGGANRTDLACTSGPDDTARQLAARTGIAAHDDPGALLAEADAVVLACKPQQLASLDPRLIELTAGKLVLSILAGKRLERLVQAFPKARNIVRAMPNTPGQIGAGITAWSARSPLAGGDQKIVGQILGALGKTVEVPESQLDAVTGLSGSGPAYVFEFAAALRDAGIAVGLDAATAKLLAIETLLGSAKLLEQSAVEAEELRNQVTSPNGTTQAGLEKMSAGDFRGLIRATVAAATARSVELSKGA